MRQKILITLMTLLTILTIWAWYENIYQFDFFSTKNRHLRNQKKIEIINEKNIDSLRQKAVKVLDNYEQHRSESDEASIKTQNILAVAAGLSVLTLILLLFELRAKTTDK